MLSGWVLLSSPPFLTSFAVDGSVDRATDRWHDSNWISILILSVPGSDAILGYFPLDKSLKRCMNQRECC